MYLQYLTAACDETKTHMQGHPYILTFLKKNKWERDPEKLTCCIVSVKPERDVHEDKMRN